MSIDTSTAFVSYAREDLEFVLRLAKDLKAKGAKVWMDKLDIRPGQRWETEIQLAVDSCSRMLVVLSPAAVMSPNLLAEASLAIDEGKQVIPVLYRDCKIPYRLRPFQYANFTVDYTTGMEDLLASLEIVSQPSPGGSVEPAGFDHRPREPRAERPRSEQQRRRVQTATTDESKTEIPGHQVGPKPLHHIREKDDGPTQIPSAIRRIVLEPKTKLYAAGLTLGILILTTVAYWLFRSPWRPQTSGTDQRLLSVVLGKNLSLWAVGQSGTIVHTDDGGRTWTPLASNTGKDLQSLAFVQPESLWAVGQDGTILRTDDGGKKWEPQESGTQLYLNSVVFKSDVTGVSGWVVGNHGTILHTEDGARVWSPQVSETDQDLYCVTFVDRQRGWSVGKAGTLLHTEDGGKNWSKQTSGTGEPLHAVAFVSSLSGWAVGGRGTVLHTDDGGNRWNPQTSGTDKLLISVVFITQQSGWAVGNDGKILHTEDGGNSWKSRRSGTTSKLMSVAFRSPNLGWVVGDHGTIRRFRR